METSITNLFYKRAQVRPPGFIQVIEDWINETTGGAYQIARQLNGGITVTDDKKNYYSEARTPAEELYNVIGTVFSDLYVKDAFKMDIRLEEAFVGRRRVGYNPYDDYCDDGPLMTWFLDIVPIKDDNNEE